MYMLDVWKEISKHHSKKRFFHLLISFNALYKHIFILNYKNADVYRMGKPIITRNWFASQICFVYRYLRDQVSSEGSEIFFLRTGVEFFK